MVDTRRPFRRSSPENAARDGAGRATLTAARRPGRRARKAPLRLPMKSPRRGWRPSRRPSTYQMNAPRSVTFAGRAGSFWRTANAVKRIALLAENADAEPVSLSNLQHNGYEVVAHGNDRTSANKLLRAQSQAILCRKHLQIIVGAPSRGTEASSDSQHMCDDFVASVPEVWSWNQLGARVLGKVAQGVRASGNFSRRLRNRFSPRSHHRWQPMRCPRAIFWGAGGADCRSRRRIARRRRVQRIS